MYTQQEERCFLRKNNKKLYNNILSCFFLNKKKSCTNLDRSDIPWYGTFIEVRFLVQNWDEMGLDGLDILDECFVI